MIEVMMAVAALAVGAGGLLAGRREWPMAGALLMVGGHCATWIVIARALGRLIGCAPQAGSAAGARRWAIGVLVAALRDPVQGQGAGA